MQGMKLPQASLGFFLSRWPATNSRETASSSQGSDESPRMSRVTLKSSTIFISVGDETRVYRSVEDVPGPLRKRLEQSTNGIHSATILIADRRGREEILRAIRGG